MNDDKVFQVTVYTNKESFQYILAAKDDVDAREYAGEALASECNRRGIFPVPKIKYCDIRYMATLSNWKD